MDDIVNTIKNRLSAETLVEIMKDAKVIDNERVKEEDVRRTLEKVNLEHFIHAEELAEKLNKISEEVAVEETSVTIIDKRTSIFSVLSQSRDPNSTVTDLHTDEDYMITDSVTGFID